MSRSKSSRIAFFGPLDAPRGLAVGRGRGLGERHRSTARAAEELDEETVLALLSSEEKNNLDSCGYVWRRELGVVWVDPKGQWRRRQFTHGAYFKTPRGLFYIDSGGRVRPVEDTRP